MSGAVDLYESVNVNLAFIYNSAIFQFYQGICRKIMFFGIYVKKLCKHNYVNFRNKGGSAGQQRHPTGYIWCCSPAERSISATSLPLPYSKPPNKEKSGVLHFFVNFHKTSTAPFFVSASPAAQESRQHTSS